VDDCRTGKIGEAHFREPATAPGPGTLDRVDDRGQQDDEQHERPQLDALGHRAGNDRGGGCHEDHLEEPVRSYGVAVLDDGADQRVGGLFGAQQGEFGLAGVIEQRERADKTAIHIGVHQIVADQVVHDAGDRIERDVLQADRRGVLTAH
jgi:hypothetical protein